VKVTPRERVLKTLSGGQADQVPWFGDLDYWATALIARGERPKDFKEGDDYIQWHRELGVGFYLQGYFPFKEIIEGCEVNEWTEGVLRFRRIRTPRGTLQECWKWSELTCSEAPVERLVKSVADLPAYRYLFECMRYEPDYAFARRRAGQVGEIGVVLCYLPRSPLMRLVAIDAGIENVVMMNADDPEAFLETFRRLSASEDRSSQLAVDSPAEILMIPENLSAEVVGPRLFELFLRDFQTRWSNKIIAAGKFSCIHMDGTLHGLLREESAIGLTFVEAMTPAPVGDLAIRDWERYRGGSEVIYWGGIPGAYFTPAVSDEEFDRHVKEVLAVMRRDRRYVLGVADQVPPDCLERRVRRVRQLVDDFGAYG
jgi:hypothetical protein